MTQMPERPGLIETGGDDGVLDQSVRTRVRKHLLDAFAQPVGVLG